MPYKNHEKRKSFLKEYYQKNKSNWIDYKNKPKTKEQKQIAKLKKIRWKEEHPETYLYSNAKYRAKKCNLDFNITPSDLIIPKFCPYLNIELCSKKGNRKKDNLMSIDRINPKFGYVKGNVEVISYKANRMKNNATIVELLIFSENVIKKYQNNIPRF